MMTTTSSPLFNELRQALAAKHPQPAFLQAAVGDNEIKTRIDASDLPALSKAALHLRNDDLDSCHRLIQDSETPDANYLHGILHRREKDFDNAEYWFRRVGSHPVARRLAARFPDYDPRGLSSLCRNAPEEELDSLHRLQVAELEALLDHFASL